jgi:hypothetical protein
VVFKDNSGGKFVDCRNGDGAWAVTRIENAVQAVARDLFASALLGLEAADYPVVLHVHDEIVAEVPEGVGSAAEFLQILSTPPEWARGLPIAAKVRSGPRFCKTDKSPKAAEEACAEEECKANAAFDEVSWSGQPKSRRAENGSGTRESGQWRHDDGYASGEREWGGNVNEYIYRDQSGAPYLKVVRTSKKQFSSISLGGRQVAERQAKGPKIPYRLPELLAAPPDAWVHVFEGEKDADNGAALGLVATAHSEGAEGWFNDLVMWFVGRQVIIHEDNDDAGRRHTGIIAFALKAATKEIRVLKYEELSENGDFSDWLDQGHTLADLQQRIDAAPPYKCALEIRCAGKLMPIPPTTKES